METTIALRRSMDDLVFEGRNKAYGAFQLRRLYDKHMTRAMIIAFLLFLLAVNVPKIIQLVTGFLPVTETVPLNTEVKLSDPPPINTKKPTPPPAPVVKPPSLKPQIQFVPPVVVRDDIADEAPLPPTIGELEGVDISTQTREGDENGIDVSLIDAPPAPEPIEEDGDEEVFTYVEQMPSFPDGQDAMYKYIAGKIKYPAIARENGISGRVVVQFVVSKEGEILYARVVSGLGGGLNEEALQVVNGMPRWKPGKHNGRPVAVTFTLPIKFVLQ